MDFYWGTLIGLIAGSVGPSRSKGRSGRERAEGKTHRGTERQIHTMFQNIRILSDGLQETGLETAHDEQESRCGEKKADMTVNYSVTIQGQRNLAH